MCKHVAAALYGVGAMLDQKPQLLFVLRGVDESDLFAGSGEDISLSQAPPAANVLNDGDVAALFGLEMADAADSKVSDDSRQVSKPSKSARAEKKKTKVKTTAASPRATPHNSNTRKNTSARKRPVRASNGDRPAT
jgi:uncharacterized Zn finger protein